MGEVGIGKRDEGRSVLPVLCVCVHVFVNIYSSTCRFMRVHVCTSAFLNCSSHEFKQFPLLLFYVYECEGLSNRPKHGTSRSCFLLFPLPC